MLNQKISTGSRVAKSISGIEHIDLDSAMRSDVKSKSEADLDDDGTGELLGIIKTKFGTNFQVKKLFIELKPDMQKMSYKKLTLQTTASFLVVIATLSSITTIFRDQKSTDFTTG